MTNSRRIEATKNYNSTRCCFLFWSFLCRCLLLSRILSLCLRSILFFFLWSTTSTKNLQLTTNSFGDKFSLLVIPITMTVASQSHTLRLSRSGSFYSFGNELLEIFHNFL